MAQYGNIIVVITDRGLSHGLNYPAGCGFGTAWAEDRKGVLASMWVGMHP